VILGTPEVRSPRAASRSATGCVSNLESARGGPMYAQGCILYEMLAGREAVTVWEDRVS